MAANVGWNEETTVTVTIYVWDSEPAKSRFKLAFDRVQVREVAESTHFWWQYTILALFIESPHAARLYLKPPFHVRIIR